MSPLSAKLAAALISREERSIRRRLPPPSPSSNLVDFSSNDYLSLASSPTFRSNFLSRLHAAPDILGSGGSRLLVNGDAHTALEIRLARFFAAPAALLFNSGFDANVGLFTCVPQPGDVVVYDEYIHASVIDGIRASRVVSGGGGVYSFAHNHLPAFRRVLTKVKNERAGLRLGEDSVFVAVESVYSMEGTLAPLREMLAVMDELFPMGNCHVVVDEAHATGMYGPQGKGVVAMLGLEHRVLARLHTFGKALASTGGASRSCQ